MTALTKAQLQEELGNLRTDFESSKEKPFDPLEHKDKTRSTIALYVVKAYFILIGIVLVGVPIYNIAITGSTIDSLSVKDILSMLSGIISGPFGFVVGYYFKGTERE